MSERGRQLSTQGEPSAMEPCLDCRNAQPESFANLAIWDSFEITQDHYRLIFWRKLIERLLEEPVQLLRKQAPLDLARPIDHGYQMMSIRLILG